MNRLKLIKRKNFLIILINVLVMVLLGVSYSYAEWTAYNDCGDSGNTNWDSDDPNVTNYGASDSPWGNLKRYSDGSDSGVSISYSGNLNEGWGAENDGGSGRTPPVYPPSGTDAYNEFGTKINVAGISYCTTGNSMTVSFSGVLSSKKYTLVVLGMRGRYNNRWSSYTITGVSSYENNSSTGIPSSDRIGNTTVYCAGDNYDNGYVAKWTNVVPESTSITLTIKGVAHGADPANKGYLSAIKLVEQLLDETRISNYTSGTPTVPPTTVDKSTTGNCLGTFRFDGAGTVSQITITEYGTCDAANDLENVKLFQDDGDGDWEPGDDTTQLGSTTTFSGASSTATFSGFSLVAYSTCYVHVVLDVKDTAPIKETIGIEISTSTDVASTKEVTAPFWPVQLGTALVGPFITVSNYTEGDPTVPPSKVYRGITKNCLGTFKFDGWGTISEITITEYGTCDAVNDLENIKLFQDDGDGNWESGDDTTQLGSTTTFSASFSTATFSGLNLTAGATCYVHIVLDVLSDATTGQTVGIELYQDDIVCTSTATASSWPVKLGTSTIILQQVTVSNYTGGSPSVPPGTVYKQSTQNCLGTFRFDDLGTISQITITEYGICDALNDLENVKLFQDDGDGNWESGDDTTQLGSTTNFNSSNEATFSSLDLTASATCYVHVVLDVNSNATDDETVGIELYQDDIVCTTTTTASGWPVQLGTSNIATYTAEATVAFVGDGRPRLFGDGESQLTNDLNQIDDQMGSGWTLDAVVTTGDMDYVSEAGQQTLDDAYAVSDVSTTPVFYAVGNHEIDNSYDMPVLRNKFSGYFYNPSSGPANCEQTTYSYDVGDIHVAVLNVYYDGTSDTGTNGDVVNELFDWLKDDLRNTTKPYKVVVAHESAYPEAWQRHFGDSLDGHPDNRDRFWNLLKTERVLAYFCGHTHNHKFEDYDGVFECDTGVSGGMVGGGSNDDFATIFYAHFDETNGFQIRAVNEDPSWASPTVVTKTRSDLETQVMVNTAERAGTRCSYFIDYTAADESNPDWSGNNSSKWWESAFSTATANWSSGELCVGYDTGGAWPWMNTEIDNKNGLYGVFIQVPFTCYDKSSYNGMRLQVDYDDAVTVWLNGTEIHKSANAPTVSADDIWDKTTSASHGADGDGDKNPDYTNGTFDVTSYMSSLNEGSNFLAIGNWNRATTSSDLAAGIKLYLTIEVTTTTVSGYHDGTPTAPPSIVDKPSTGNCLGTFKFDGAGTISQITITEYGTCDAVNDLENVKLFQDDGDGNWESLEDTTQLGSTTTFSGASSTATFSGFNLTAGVACYVHVVLDVKVSATTTDTIDIQISDSTDIESTASLVEADSWPVQLGTSYIGDVTVVSNYTEGDLTVPPSKVYRDTTKNCLGTFKFDGSGTISEITITEYGTCDAPNDLENIKLFQDDGDGNWESGDDTTQLGSTTNFNSSNEATFSSLNLTASATCYAHVVLDVNANATDDETVGIELYQDDIVCTTTTTASGWPVQLGTSNIATYTGEATIAFVGDGRPRLFGDGESQLTNDLNQIDDQMGPGWTLDAVVTTGDMDYVSEAGQQTFDDAYAVSDISTTPLFYAVGNHETDNSYDMPVLRNKFSGYSFNPNSGPANCEQTTYSYDVGDIHVAVINVYYDGTSDTGTNGDVVNALFDWLKDDLRNTTKPYKVVVAHEPAYPEAWQRHKGNSLDGHRDNRDRFWNLLKTERVLAYFCGHTHNHKFEDYDGVFECDTGVSGGMVGGGGYDDFATIFYAHFDETNGFQIRAVNEDPSWASPIVVTKTRADLETQVMVNTAERAGTRGSYFIDYTAADESNPDWSGNNSSKWWESAFSTATANWSSGELCVGYDTGGAWPWMNTEIDNKNGVYGVFIQVPFTCYDKSSYSSMELQVDYDDAVTVWLNGTEIHKSANAPTVGADDIWDKTASGAHSARGNGDKNPDYTNGTFDVTSYMSSLNEGSNFLAIGNWNGKTDSSDLAAGIKLYLTTEIATTTVSGYHDGTPTVPPSYVYTQSTGNCLGTFKFDGAGTISQITITEYGTCDAPNDLGNVKLFQDDGDGNWEPLEDTTQIGSTTTFSGASSTATFSGFNLTVGVACYVHVVLDVKSTASHNDTIGIQISQSSDVTSTKNVTASSWPVQLGASTIRDVTSPEVMAKPREPCGIKGRFLSSKVFEVSWSKVTKDTRGEKENLEGYNVYRATSTEGEWAGINSVGNSVFSSTDVVNGEVYYYRIKAEDIDGNESKGSMIVDTTEKINVIAVADDDPKNQIKMSKEINSILYKGDVYDEDINIVLERDDEEEKDGDTITCYDIKAMEADSGKEIKDFVFARPLAKIVLAYEVENGHIKRVSSIPEDRASEQLALFWFNGLEWIKFGGEVDEDLHLASIRSKRIGKYMIKKSLRATSFVIEGIHPDKIFTPNGDGWNDYIEIQYANPKDGIVSGKIYDLRGALVAGMEKGGNDDTLKWDGKDTNSNPVPGGVYIYQIQVTGPENKVINGTVVVAR